jgi:membrane protein
VDEIDSSASSGTLISITAITALWSAGKGFFAIMKGMNSVYEINETRKSIFLRLLSTIYTLIFAILLIASMVLLVFGNRLYIWIEQKFPVLKDLALLIISLRTIVGLIILLVFFLFIYVVIPNRKTRFINELPGALVSAGGWMAFSYAFSYYIDHYSNYASMYGSLTAIVLFMLWMYCCMYILFIGAEINLLVENKAVINKIKQLYKKDKAENIYK